MNGPTPYVFFPGNAEEALRFYQGVFGGDLQLSRYAEFRRGDGPGDAIAHGVLGGVVRLYGAAAGFDEDAVNAGGLMLALLGTAEAATLHRWFETLATSGRVIEALEARTWGAVDGQVQDQYGLRWLVGYETAAPNTRGES